MSQQEPKDTIREEETEIQEDPSVDLSGQDTTGIETAADIAEAAEAEAANAPEEAVSPLERELEAARREAAEAQERFLRTQADYDNFRRRTRQEREDAAKYASRPVIENLLPILDNFERASGAAKASNDFNALVKGLDMVFRQISELLEAEGVKAVESVGTPFNPEFHQAVMQVESDEHEEGIVVEELQKGYLYKDKVIRPAMVKVSS